MHRLPSVLLIAACARPGAPEAAPAAAPAPNPSRDVEHFSLVIDLAHDHDVAIVRFGPSSAAGASLDVRGLELESVRWAGRPLDWARHGTRLDLALPALDEPAEVRIAYSRTGPERGPIAHAGAGSTLTWPDGCGNLWPCHPNPLDGATYELRFLGGRAVAPRAITSEVPAYAIAWVEGDRDWVRLGETSAGTEIGYWIVPGDAEAEARRGTVALVGAFDWLETHLGAYAFGERAGPVQVDWGRVALNAMEHHPFWHVNAQAMGNGRVHVHEAVHGWYGNGVRPACWSDLVLSEGTTTWLTAVVLGEVVGPEAEAAAWDEVHASVAARPHRPLWEDACTPILGDPVTAAGDSAVRGAAFFRRVEEEVGRDALIATVGRFYRDRVGTAARFDDLLDAIAADTGFDARPLAQRDLRD